MKSRAHTCRHKRRGEGRPQQKLTSLRAPVPGIGSSNTRSLVGRGLHRRDGQLAQVHAPPLLSGQVGEVVHGHCVVSRLTRGCSGGGGGGERTQNNSASFA